MPSLSDLQSDFDALATVNALVGAKPVLSTYCSSVGPSRIPLSPVSVAPGPHDMDSLDVVGGIGRLAKLCGMMIADLVAETEHLASLLPMRKTPRTIFVERVAFEVFGDGSVYRVKLVVGWEGGRELSVSLRNAAQSERSSPERPIRNGKPWQRSSSICCPPGIRKDKGSNVRPSLSDPGSIDLENHCGVDGCQLTTDHFHPLRIVMEDDSKVAL